MALDFTALQTEFFARGFDFLNDAGAGLTRAKRWLNDAAHEIDELEDWPYLNASTTGAAPLTIADLRTVESVAIVSDMLVLEPQDRRSLVDYYVDLTTTGTPTFYYITTGTTINVYPANTSKTLTVRYWKFTADMSAGTDAPAMPDRFRMAVVERACAKAYRDSDNPQAAADCLGESERIVQTMRESLLLPQHHQAETIVRTGSSVDDAGWWY